MPSTPPLVVSACLAGVPCRYDGRAKPDSEVIELVKEGKALPLCAEVLGNLPTPRPAVEIVGGDGADVLSGKARVTNTSGDDFTQEFVDGARAAADRAEEAGATRAILQALSPSCGCGTIYDGTMAGTKKTGDGVFATELKARGIEVEARRGDSSS